MRTAFLLKACRGAAGDVVVGPANTMLSTACVCDSPTASETLECTFKFCRDKDEEEKHEAPFLQLMFGR
jgi:hypothetical protein